MTGSSARGRNLEFLRFSILSTATVGIDERERSGLMVGLSSGGLSSGGPVFWWACHLVGRRVSIPAP